MAGGATCSKVIVVNIQDTILHLRKGHAITSEPVTKGKPMMAKYEIIKTTFFDIIHADEIGITVMWDRGTRLRVHIKPSFKGKQQASSERVCLSVCVFRCVCHTYILHSAHF